MNCKVDERYAQYYTRFVRLSNANLILSRVSTLTRNIDIAILSVCPPVCP